MIDVTFADKIRKASSRIELAQRTTSPVLFLASFCLLTHLLSHVNHRIADLLQNVTITLPSQSPSSLLSEIGPWSH